MKEKVFIDTDMGADDMMAIGLLFANNIPIVGISTVNGLASAQIGYSNLSKMVSFLDGSIPLYQGSEQALQEKEAQFPTRLRSRVERLNLFPTLQFSNDPITPKIKSDETIEDILFQEITPDTTILALGPLTNIAKTIQKYGNKFTNNIKNLVIMGGGIEQGNVPPDKSVEYNILLDPEAAQIVFSSDIPITLVPVDATTFAPATEEFREKIRRLVPKNKIALLLQEGLLYNNNDYGQLYDPLAAMILIRADLVTKSELSNIEVMLAGKDRGKTVKKFTESPNVKIVTGINSEEFFKALLDLFDES